VRGDLNAKGAKEQRAKGVEKVFLGDLGDRTLRPLRFNLPFVNTLLACRPCTGLRMTYLALLAGLFFLKAIFRN
jgi:hypothetical protein